MGRLDPDIIPLLRCPRCRSNLQAGPAFYVCASCGAAYPVREGVPILLNETSVFKVADVKAVGPSAGRARGKCQRIARVLPSVSREFGTVSRMDRFTELLLGIAPRPRVLVIGGQTPGTGMERLPAGGIDVVSTDVVIGPETVIVCDAHDIPFADGSFDGVVAQAVLEHVADPYRCVSEIHRVLMAGGLVYAELPFMQQVHGGRYDFTRFTYVGQRRLFRWFEQIVSGAVCGPGMALAWAWQYFLMSLLPGRYGRRLAALIVRVTAFWFPLVARFLIDRAEALDGASALFLMGRLVDEPLSDREIVASYRGGAHLTAPDAWYERRPDAPAR